GALLGGEVLRREPVVGRTVGGPVSLLQLAQRHTPSRFPSDRARSPAATSDTRARQTVIRSPYGLGRPPQNDPVDNLCRVCGGQMDDSPPGSAALWTGPVDNKV